MPLTEFGSLAIRLLEKALGTLLPSWKQRHRELTEHVYRPLYEQLYRGLKQVEHGQRPHAVDLDLWEKLQANARAKRVPRRLAAEIEAVLRLLREYDTRWIEFHRDTVSAVREGLDRRFGGPTGGLLVYDLDWPRLFADASFLASVRALGPKEGLRLWNQAITPTRMKEMGLTQEGFLLECRREIQENANVRQFQGLRVQAMNQTADLIRHLHEKL